MGRRWLGVSHRDYLRMPHAESWPESLWWFVLRPGESTAARNTTIDTYLKRYARGAATPDGFRDELIACLKDLTTIQNLAPWGKPRTKRCWTIPDYARANKIRPHTLMKRLRELERVAIELFPDKAAVHRRRSLKLEPLSETELAAMVNDFWKDVDISKIAAAHRLSPAHVAKLLEFEKDLKHATRALEDAEANK